MGVKERYNFKNGYNFNKDGVQKRYEARQLYNDTVKNIDILISDFNSIKIPDVSKYGDYSSSAGSYGKIAFRADKLKKSLEQLKNYGYVEQYSQLSKILEDIKYGADTNRYHLQDVNDFYSSFEDENQYKAWDTDRRLYAEHGDLTTENVDYFIRSMEKRKAKGELNGYEQEFYDWIKQYDLTHGYKDKEYVKKRLEQLNQDLLEASKDNGSHYDDHGRKWTLKSAKYSEIEGRIGDINKLHTDYNLENAYKDKGYSLNKGAIGFEEKAAKYENSVTGEVNKPTSPQNVIKTKDIEDKVVFAYKNKEKYSRGSWDTNFGWSEYTGFDTVEAGVIESWYKYSLLESEEFSTYCYLAQEDKEKGTNSAEKFLSDMEATLDMREAEELRKSRKADMNKEGFKGAFSTGLYNRLSIPASVLGGVQALPSAAYSLIKGEDINIYSDSFTLSNFASDVRAITSEKIDSPAWNLVYNAVMSTADSLLAAFVFRDAAPYVLAASAATSRMKELVSQGASDFEIVVGSLASGLIEVVTEKISIDRLFDGDIKPTKFKEWLVNGVIQSCVEGSEEIASEVLNNLSDEILRGQMSDYNQKIRKYQAEGLSKSEATKKASNEILVNIMEAALSGMISGGIGGAVAGGSQMHKFNVIGSNIIKGDNIDSVLNAAEYLGKLDPEIAGQVKALNNFKEKATKGKSNAAYNRTLGKVAVTVAENAIDVKQNIVESAVSKELKIRKAGADVVNKVSKIVSKYIAGEKLSSSEQGYLKHNNVAATVMQEIKAAQEQIKAESVTSIDAQNSSTVPSAPQWAVDMVKALNVVDCAVGIVKYAATGKTKEDEHQAEVNRMIKLLSIASGKTTAEQEAEAGDIPYSQYIKEKESAAQKENTAENSGDTSHMEDVDGENVIKMDMPDSERAEILENTTIEVVEYGSNDIQSTEEAALYGVSDIEKAVADYVESNIADIEQDIEVLDVKNINAGTRNGFVRKLSNGTYESGTYGTGSGGIVPNENIVRTDSLEEAISEQYKYMLENSSGNVRYIIQKHANNYNNNHNDTKKSQLSDETVEELKNTYKSKAQGILKALCEKFGIFKDYSNDNISLEFNYSRGSLNESVHKQNERGGDYSNFAKMLSLFDDIILNAQPIECHSDKYVETNREDKNLKRVYVLLSAFKDGNSIIPIELSIKEFKSNDKNKLYISVTMKKIEADLMETPPNAERSTKISKSTSIYSLPQIIKNINPSDGDFLKYVPDELLNEEQLQSKNEALEREEVRLENMKNDYLRTTVSEKTVTKRKKSVEKLTKLFGLGLEWSESVKRGKYNPNSRTVMLNPNLTLREMYLEVLKHEFTHDLENRKLYKKFKNFLFESSKSFIEFCEQRVKELTGQTIKGKDAVYALRGEVYMAYKKSKELTEEERTAFNRESAEREMVCDFVAKKLLAEENEETAVKALAELAENQPTIWERFTQWLRDILFEIKHSHNKTDSAQEIKYIESLLKRVYDSKVTDTGETVIKHDIKTDIDGNVFVDIPMNNINVTDGNSIAKNIAIFISKKFKNLIDVYGQKIQINKTTNDEFRNSNYSRYILGKNTQEYFDKLSTINNADEILKVAKNWIGRELEHQRKDDIVEFAEAYVRYRVSNRGYIAKVLVATRLNGAAVLYDITDIRNIKITESPFTMADKNPQRRKNDSVISRISQNIDEVNNNSYNIESHSIEIPYFNDFEKVNSKHYIDMKSAEKTQLTEFPDLMAVLTDRRKRGEISEEDYMLEVRDLLDRASEKYGVIEQGELAENKMQLPKRVTSDKSEKTKRWVRTVHESGILPEDMEVELEAEILKEAMSYKVINNAEAQRQANTAIQRGTALKEWEAAVNSDGLVGKREIAIGETLLKLAAERKDSKTVMKLIAEVSEMGTRAGQVVQAMSMLKRMDGIGQLYYVQKCVEKINRGLDKRFARKVKKGKLSGIPQVKINETLANQLANSKTKEDFEVTYEAMMQSIAEQVPTTFLDKWNAWRYFAMLFNPRTHIRNILGNFGFIPAVRTKDMLASAIERIFLDKSEYTKSAIVKKEYREFALNDFAEAESIITGSGKMNPSDEIRDKQAVFDTKWLEKLRKWNFDALEKEDAIFLKKHYSHALGGFLQARNIDITKDIESSVMEEARKYAIMEAQKATYRDASSIVNVLQRTTHTKSQVWNSIVEGVLPFKKTPINIVRSGIEYSPIGLIKTLTKGNYDLVNGDITASQFIDGIAGGLTGTGIVLLGILLSSLGFINVTGGFGDDEEDDINRLLGRQEYAVEIAGHSYTIDWMAPACIPLFIGVEIQNALEEKGNANFIQSIKNVTGSALEPIINLSMLSGMQDILSSAKYSDGAAVVSSVLWNIALSYGSQALPSLTGAVARTIDGKRRTTYIDRNSWLSDMGQMALNKVESKIPFASKLRSEYVDEFGRTEESGNVFTRAIQNFFSPGYYSKIEEDPVIEELRTLYEQTGETVLPTKPKKYINVNGYKKNLTAEEYEEYAIEVGQERYDYLKELFGNSQSRTLSYEEKRKVISDLYSYALAKGKTHYSEYKLPDLYEKAYEAEKNGISPVDYYLSKIATNVENADTDGSGTVTKNERLAAIYEMDVSNDIKAALIALYS